MSDAPQVDPSILFRDLQPRSRAALSFALHTAQMEGLSGTLTITIPSTRKKDSSCELHFSTQI